MYDFVSKYVGCRDCTLVVQNCKNCTNKTTCNECNEGYIFHDNKCISTICGSG